MYAQNQKAQKKQKQRSKTSAGVPASDHDFRLFPDDEVFTCAGCGIAIGRAKEMYNLRLRDRHRNDLARVTAEELLKLVRCDICAKRVARSGRRPGANGSGVFRLASTLRRIDEHRRVVPSGSRKDHTDRGRGRKVAGPDKARLRRQKEEAIVTWAHTYATTAIGDLVEDSMPENKFGFCGVPPCGHRLSDIDKDDARVSYLTRPDGVIVGICLRCAAVLGKIARRQPHDDRYKRLLSTRDRSLAERIADRTVSASHAVRHVNGQSPLSAGMTVERKAHKKKRNEANRERKRAENRERALSHGHGGSKKGGQQEGGKKGKKKHKR